MDYPLFNLTLLNQFDAGSVLPISSITFFGVSSCIPDKPTETDEKNSRIDHGTKALIRALHLLQSRHQPSFFTARMTVLPPM
ncbi:hypothetical protein D3C87_1809540 [compost metagenome]